MSRAPPVYNPKIKSLKEKFDCSPDEQRKVLAAVLVGHARAMADEKLPFFSGLDDPRPGPESSDEAVRTVDGSIDEIMANDSDNPAYCFALDYVFRLLRYVGKENSYLNSDASKLVAAAAKACILKVNAASALRNVIAFYRANNIGQSVDHIDEFSLCKECQTPLTGQVSLWRENKYHRECFNCYKCGANLATTQFAIEKGPCCIGGCSQQASRPTPATLTDTAASEISLSSVDDVCRELERLNITNVDVFRRELIDGDALKSLSEADLIDELGLALGDRKKVLELIRRMQ